MRPLNESPSNRLHASQRQLADVDELLARDLDGALPDPSATLGPRVRRALEEARRDPTPTRSLRPLALVAAAALLLALLALALRERAGSADIPRQVVERSIALRLPGRAELDELLGDPAARLYAALEAPLLDEARLLAGDGRRVARALVEALPSPLRRPLAPAR